MPAFVKLTGLPSPWVWLWVFHKYLMGVGAVFNPHGPTGILWGFLNRCEIQWKRLKHVEKNCVMLIFKHILYSFTI